MGVAIGGGVDDDLDALAMAVGDLRGVGVVTSAVLGTQINGGFGRGLTAGNLVKFAAVIAGEKDVVMREVETF